MSRARVTSPRAPRHAHRHCDVSTGQRQSAEHAKFRIFQIGPLLAEIQPIM